MAPPKKETSNSPGRSEGRANCRTICWVLALASCGRFRREDGRIWGDRYPWSSRHFLIDCLQASIRTYFGTAHIIIQAPRVF
jgi:hypothetical protein